MPTGLPFFAVIRLFRVTFDPPCGHDHLDTDSFPIAGNNSIFAYNHRLSCHSSWLFQIVINAFIS